MLFELLSLFGLVTQAEYDGNNIDTVHRHSWHYGSQLMPLCYKKMGAIKKGILQKQECLNVGKYGCFELQSRLQPLACQLPGKPFSLVVP